MHHVILPAPWLPLTQGGAALLLVSHPPPTATKGPACLPLTMALLARPRPVAGHQDQTQEKPPGQGLGFRVRVHK